MQSDNVSEEVAFPMYELLQTSPMRVSEQDFKAYVEHVLEMGTKSEREINTKIQTQLEQADEKTQTALTAKMESVARVDSAIRRIRETMMQRARGKRALHAIETIWGAFRYQVSKYARKKGQCHLTGLYAEETMPIIMVRQGEQDQVMLSELIQVSILNMGVVKAMMLLSRLRDYVRIAEKPTELVGSINEAIALLELFADALL
jgi:hypothetical protein